MNKVVLVGRLTRDPDLRFTAGSGTGVSKFTLAVDRNFKNKETGKYEADFINCIAFNKLAETIANNLTKGRRIAVVGRIQTGSYVNKDGLKVYTTDVVVDEMQFIDSKEGQQGTPGAPGPSPRTSQNDNSIPGYQDEDFMIIGNENEIPF